MESNQTRNVTFSEAVLLRPGMYTLGGTFEEAIAFLEGYYSGVAKENPYAIPVLQWTSFQNWLSQQLGVASSEVFAKLREAHENEQEARECLLEWLTRYQQESS